MSKKSKKIDQQIGSINQINLTNKIVEELLSKANPDEESIQNQGQSCFFESWVL